MVYEVQHIVPFDDLPSELIDRLFTAAGKTVTIPEQFNFSVALVSDEEIQPLNKEYRGKDYATDVLSFRYDDLSGEIVISADRIRAQAKEFGHSSRVEAAFMLVHGILHIMGWDHERSEKEATEMRALEHQILQQCGVEFAR